MIVILEAGDLLTLHFLSSLMKVPRPNVLKTSPLPSGRRHSDCPRLTRAPGRPPQTGVGSCIIIIISLFVGWFLYLRLDGFHLEGGNGELPALESVSGVFRLILRHRLSQLCAVLHIYAVELWLQNLAVQETHAVHCGRAARASSERH